MDPQLTQLLEARINTSCKLAILLKFLEHAPLCATSSEMAARVCRDIWSVEAALRELADDGVLNAHEGRYRYAAPPELDQQLRRLHVVYNDPLARTELLTILRDLERFAPYRHELRIGGFQRVA